MSALTNKNACFEAPCRVACCLWLFALLCVSAIASGLFAGRAYAADDVDVSRSASLALSCEFDRVGVPGLSVSAWRVADIDTAGGFSFIPRFEDCGVSLDDLRQSSEWDATARNIETWLGGRSDAGATAIEAEATAVSNDSGTVSFGALQPGLYLVSHSNAVFDGWRYDMAACLVSVPYRVSAESPWEYNVVAFPKIEKERVDDSGDPSEPGEDPTVPGGDSGNSGDVRPGGSTTGGATGNAAALDAWRAISAFVQTGDLPLAGIAVVLVVAAALVAVLARCRS